MKRTRELRSRAKRTRVMKQAVVIGGAALLLVGVALLVSRPASTEDTAGRYGEQLMDRTQVCMLQDTIQKQSGLEYEYQGKKYYLCCGGCLAAFKAKAAQYSTAADPVTGAKVDKALAISFAFFRGVKMKKTRILWHFYHFSAHRYRATECRKLLYC